ncbi:hypothetical protein [Corallococcus silvisoli]|uniref:hypothetical protein n=1 Tax=Corallococcus silvisoli TaxID=2697031 RepID=UPI001376D3B9|nr:hypothetical protein [Corallococcus silvisoli]NBD13149.1 hypothetical protein [Corallococcus silvisoli]
MNIKQSHSTRALLATIILTSGCGPDLLPRDAQSEPNTQSSSFAIGETCAKSEGQPGICNYGEYCLVTTSKCVATPLPTCTNFMTHGTSWDANTSTGPVIYSATVLSFAPDPNFCGTPLTKRARYRLKAYSPVADLPTSNSGFYGRFYFVTPSGGQISVTAVQNIMTATNNQHITFDVSLCLPSETTNYTAGFFFSDGNETCVTTP